MDILTQVGICLYINVYLVVTLSILISVAIDINTKKKINNKGNKKMKHVIFAHSHCTDGLCAASIIKRAINICLNTEDIVVIFARYGAEKKALEQA